MEYILPGPLFDPVAPLFAADTSIECWAPDHVVVELANVLRRKHRSEAAFSLEDVDRAIVEALSLVSLAPVVGLIRPAVRHLTALAAYDAVYVAMAEEHDMPLCTLDGSQANTARDAGLDVLLPGTEDFLAWVSR